MGVFEGVPEVVVDAGLVPDEQDFTAFGGSVVKLFGGAALDNGDVMGLFLAVFGVGRNGGWRRGSCARLTDPCR